MTGSAELPPELRGEPFDAAAARALGVHKERLRRSDVLHPFHGVYAPVARQVRLSRAPVSEADRWALLLERARSRARNYAARMPPDQFFSHVTAALLHGLPLPARFLEDAPIDVGTSNRTRRRRGREVRGHLIPADQVRILRVRGLRVASAVDAWCQLSTTLGLDDLIAMGDGLVRRKNPPATLADLHNAVTRYAGRPGARLLREALALVRAGTDSPRETRLRLLIVRAGLPEPAVNLRMLNRFGAFMALGDLVYLEYKILIEYDGGQHREDERQYLRDVDRLDEPMEEGWRVIRVNKSHLGRRSGATIRRIRTALLERGWTP